MERAALEERDPLIVTWLWALDPKTRETYRYGIRVLIRAADILYPGLPLRLIAEEHMVRIADLVKRREPEARTWNLWVSSWRSLFRWLVDGGQMQADPSRRIRRRVPPDRPQPCPTEDEVRKMWRVVNSDSEWVHATRHQRLCIIRDRALLALVIGCGLRNVEIRRLKRKHFDCEKRLIDVHGKRDKRGLQPWSKAIDIYLEPLLSGLGPEDYVMVNTVGRPMSRHNLNDRLHAICATANTRIFSAHAFRRFAMTDIIEKHGLHKANLFGRHDPRSLSVTAAYNQKRFAQVVTGHLYDEPVVRPQHSAALTAGHAATYSGGTGYHRRDRREGIGSPEYERRNERRRKKKRRHHRDDDRTTA